VLEALRNAGRYPFSGSTEGGASLGFDDAPFPPFPTPPVRSPPPGPDEDPSRRSLPPRLPIPVERIFWQVPADKFQVPEILAWPEEPLQGRALTPAEYHVMELEYLASRGLDRYQQADLRCLARLTEMAAAGMSPAAARRRREEELAEFWRLLASGTLTQGEVDALKLRHIADMCGDELRRLDEYAFFVRQAEAEEAFADAPVDRWHTEFSGSIPLSVMCERNPAWPPCLEFAAERCDIRYPHIILQEALLRFRCVDEAGEIARIQGEVAQAEADTADDCYPLFDFAYGPERWGTLGECSDHSFWECLAFPFCCLPGCKVNPICLALGVIKEVLLNDGKSICGIDSGELFNSWGHTIMNIGDPWGRVIDATSTFIGRPLPEPWKRFLKQLGRSDSMRPYRDEWPSDRAIETAMIAHKGECYFPGFVFPPCWAVMGMPRQALVLGKVIAFKERTGPYSTIMEKLPPTVGQMACQNWRVPEELRGTTLLLIHEIVHVGQADRMGTSAFLHQYTGESLDGVHGNNALEEAPTDITNLWDKRKYKCGEDGAATAPTAAEEPPPPRFF